MIENVKAWMLAVIAASILCAVADSLMPQGALKRVGRLVCAMVLVCALLSPLGTFDLGAGGQWLDDFFAARKSAEQELTQQVNDEMKLIIQQRFAAYIVDKAREDGVLCTAEVACEQDQDGLYLPREAHITGELSPTQQSRLTQLLQDELSIPMQRQFYYVGEGAA